MEFVASFILGSFGCIVGVAGMYLAAQAWKTAEYNSQVSIAVSSMDKYEIRHSNSSAIFREIKHNNPDKWATMKPKFELLSQARKQNQEVLNNMWLRSTKMKHFPGSFWRVLKANEEIVNAYHFFAIENQYE